MREALVTMSIQEMDRLGIIRRLVEGQLSQKKAAAMMGLSSRQRQAVASGVRARGLNRSRDQTPRATQ